MSAATVTTLPSFTEPNATPQRRSFARATAVPAQPLVEISTGKTGVPVDCMNNPLEYHLSIPDAAMYGELKRLASLTQAPMSFAYPIAIALHAGRGINMHETSPRYHPTAYTVLGSPLDT